MKELIINRIGKYCSLLMLLCISITPAKASHYAAADLFITYIGAGVDGCTGTTEYKYSVTFDIYKACEAGSIDLPAQVNVSYFSNNAGFNGIIPLNAPTIDTLDGLCDNFKDSNSCHVPANLNRFPGFVRHRFEGTVTLPSAQTDWVFWWSGGTRNGAITNLQGPSGTDIYIEAGLNNLTKYNNSTPRFVVEPLPYICVNRPATYLNGPYDPNGDSLRVYNQVPLDNGPNAPIIFAPGYSLNDPVASSIDNPYKVNAQTGTATFTPTLQGLFVLGFRCEEYERGTGIQLGYIMRDVQISVLRCQSPPPPIDSLPTSITKGTVVKTDEGNAIFVCPGSDLEFDITTTSQVNNSSVFMEANTNTIFNSNFTTVGDGTNSVTGTFSWTPTQNDIGEHTLIITSKDSTCTGSGFSIVLKNYTVFTIKVVDGLDAGPDVPICELNPVEKQLYVKGADELRVEWTDISGGPAVALSNASIHNPIADPKGDATYLVYTPDLTGTCKSRDTVAIFIDTSNMVTSLPRNPAIQCRPDYVQLEAVIKGKPPVSNVPCGIGNPTSCDNPDSVLLYGSTVYGSLGYDSTGAASPIMNNDKYTKKIQYLLHRSELHEYGLRSATINQIGFECIGNTIPTFKYGNFTISMKCTKKDELKASDGFETGLIQVYNSDDELLDDGWHDYQLQRPYTWDTTKNLVIEICYSDNEVIVQNCTPLTGGQPPILRYAPTTYVSGLTLTPDNIIDKGVCNVVNSADIEEVAARPVFRFAYCEADPQPFTINWTPGRYLSDSTIEQPLAYVPTSTDYVVETFGRNGCTIRDTVSIYVPKHDFKVYPKDSAICFGDKTPIYIANGFSYKWYEYDAATDSYNDASGSLNCTDCRYVIASPKKTTTYRISVSDSVWCFDTLEATLNVMPLPEVRLLNTDTTIKYGQSIKLLATGARMYNWSPVSSLTNPNISYPIATPKEATRYIVGGLGANGCRAYDTLYVSINYRDNLFVPSAFSPNGDGKNDVFRIANITFQKIVEFRVFNRWGQEIYSGAGNNVSWDGTWKGTPQDMGTYSYIIRVASPDGEVETYKGDITLIR